MISTITKDPKNTKQLSKEFAIECTDSVVNSESSFHQLSPYIGKIKSSIAKFLILNFTQPGSVVCDPFCGAGTIPLESWFLNRNVIANDLNKYAQVLTHAKLFPPANLEKALCDIETYSGIVETQKLEIDLRKTPTWVREFFHKETLRETIAWFQVLQENDENFLLACMLGILHHQRPGFLSYPSSHTVPYLRKNKFPPTKFPELYEYRSVQDRLLKKVQRAFKRMPLIDNNVERTCYCLDARTMNLPDLGIDAIITSPPYMRKLDYARDNRLRLWFLGFNNSYELDASISPKEFDFIEMMKDCLVRWKKSLKANGKCILFLGDNYSKKYKMKLPEVIEKIAEEEIGGYRLLFKHVSLIPQNRRVRRNYQGNKSETILVFQKIY